MTRIVVLGDLNLDIFARDDHSVDRGDEIRAAVRALAGGSAGTFARAAAAHGAKVLFVGAVGRDRIGDLLEDSLADAGVVCHLQRVAMPSGVIVALHRGEERSMICSRGANDGLSAKAIVPKLFDDSDHLHISGYAFLSPAQLPAVERALALAAERGLSVSVDPPPANLIAAFGTARFLDLVPSTTWLFPNRTEGKLLTSESEPKAIVDQLAMRSDAGALTLGGDGSLAWRGESRHTQAVHALDSVDATGAGDAFAGTFVAALLATGDVANANQRANEAAAEHISPRAAT